MSDLILAAATAAPPDTDHAIWQIIFGAIGSMAALCTIATLAWWLIKPRFDAYIDARIAKPLDEVHHQVAVNHHRNDPPTMLDKIGDVKADVGYVKGCLEEHKKDSAREHARLWQAVSGGDDG